VINMLHRMPVDQSPVGDPERRGDERSEAPRSGGSLTGERAVAPTPPDPEVPARHVRRRFTTPYKLDILRKADACTRPGELGALLRREGLYSSHLVTWRRQRAHGLTPKTRGRKAKSSDPRVKALERENAALETANRRLERKLHRAESVIAFQKKVAELLGIPLKPLPSDEDD
jgi:transposase